MSPNHLRLAYALRWQRQCKAVDADTGKRCSLLEHTTGEHSASGRTFTTALGEGAAPRRELDELAISGSGQ